MSLAALTYKGRLQISGAIAGRHMFPMLVTPSVCATNLAPRPSAYAGFAPHAAALNAPSHSFVRSSSAAVTKVRKRGKVLRARSAAAIVAADDGRLSRIDAQNGYIKL
jgi:hypothetical protein